MLKLKYVFLFSVIAALAFGGCFKKSNVVKIAIAGPLTGQYASFGEQLAKGAHKAVADINNAGGINGKMIELVEGDDACDPKQAVTVANKLVEQDKVVAVIGHFCSSSSIPASEIYKAGGIFQITPASTNPLYTERGLNNVFRTCGRDDQQGLVAANYLIDNLKVSKVVVLHDKDTYGQGLADATKKVLNERGITEVLYEGVTRGDKDFNALITKIKSLSPDVVYFGGLHAEAGLLVKQMRDQGIQIPFVSGDGIVSADFVTAVGGAQFTKNVFMTFGKNPLKIEQGKSVIESFKADGYEPEGYTLYSYAAMQIAAEALRASDLDPVKASEYIHANSFDTVMGEKSFDSKGDLNVSDFVMFTWDGATYDEVDIDRKSVV